MYKKKLLAEIGQILPHFPLEEKIYKKFTDLFQKQKSLTKSEGEPIHLGTFFLPVDKETKSIYLIHHIKAQMWIPPGGHVEKNELPVDTVCREFKEELSFKITKKDVYIFNLSITPINRPWQNCITHYDFWYFVLSKKIPFDFLKKEFHDGKWFDLNEGLEIIERPEIRNIIKKLLEAL